MPRSAQANSPNLASLLLRVHHFRFFLLFATLALFLTGAYQSRHRQHSNTMSDSPYDARLFAMKGPSTSVQQLCNWRKVVAIHDGIVDGRNALIIPAIATPQNGVEEHVVVKRVTSEHAMNKDAGQLRDAFLKSASREIAFYDDLQGRVKKEDAKKGVFHTVERLWPVCYQQHGDAEFTEYLLVLEDMHHSGYSQSPNISESRMKHALEALAIFHAAFWKDPEVMQSERGCFWPLYKRKEDETEKNNVDAHWEAVLQHFPQLDATVAGRIAERSSEIDQIVAKSGVTKVHGDCKGPNIFFRDLENSGERPLEDSVKLIDAQWVGKGNPFSDVANLLTAGLDESLLPRFDEFFEYYDDHLIQELGKGSDSTEAAFYVEHIRPTWDAAWLDYCRVAMLGLWRGLTPERMEKSRKNVGSSMINRSTPHVEFMVQRVKEKLDAMGW